MTKICAPAEYPTSNATIKIYDRDILAGRDWELFISERPALFPKGLQGTKVRPVLSSFSCFQNQAIASRSSSMATLCSSAQGAGSPSGSAAGRGFFPKVMANITSWVPLL